MDRFLFGKNATLTPLHFIIDPKKPANALHFAFCPSVDAPKVSCDYYVPGEPSKVTSSVTSHETKTMD